MDLPENLRQKIESVDSQNIIEEETKQVTHYLPLINNLQHPIVDSITIEKFAEQNFKVFFIRKLVY